METAILIIVVGALALVALVAVVALRGQSEIKGQLSMLAQTSGETRKTLDDRLDAVSKRFGDSLEQS